jgi:NAD(P)-dependent dehydrogenase (short-subunit alcohol dehydrogenase family)
MASLKELRGTAFVSGASTGLGEAFARMLLSEGVRVWGTSRDPARLAELAAAHPGAFHSVELDLADGPGALRAFGGAAAAAGGGFDIVINNAGYGVFGEFEALESAVWRRQLEGALLTVMELSHGAYRLMRGRGRGCLVHISSLAAEFPLPYMSGYNVVKSGLSALSESLMFESRRSGITIIDFRPGDYRTNFNRAMQTESVSDTTRKVWGRLDAMLASAPPPGRAAADLRRALLANRSGVVRSGSLFQARIAPFLARILPASWVRASNAHYFGA